MARVKQFADDLGISKNQAQTLINKGRNRKDGGSQILESVMKPKKYGSGGSNVTTINKDKLSKAQMGQFRNIQSDAVKGKITSAEAEKMIRKLVLNKRVGGTYSKGPDPLNLAGPKKDKNKKAGIDGPSKTSKKKDFSDFATKSKRKARSVKKPVRVANVDDFKEAPKLDKQKAGAEKMLKTVKMAANNPRGVGGPVPKKIKKFAGGGSNSFPDLTGDGKTTQADILKGRGVPGFSRGGGIAIQGLGFKGVR
jgi:hypothetical protein